MWSRALILGCCLSAAYGGRLKRSDADSLVNSLALYQESGGMLNELTQTLGESLSGALHFVGSIVPLRGLASFAADLGVPGASSILELLTAPHTHVRARPSDAVDRVDQSEEPPLPRSYTRYKDEMSSLVGAVLGEDQCLLKLACLSGRHVNTLSGASTVTMLISAASGYLPHHLKTPYAALKESVMYTTNCQQYHCTTS